MKIQVKQGRPQGTQQRETHYAKFIEALQNISDDEHLLIAWEKNEAPKVFRRKLRAAATYYVGKFRSVSTPEGVAFWKETDDSK